MKLENRTTSRRCLLFLFAFVATWSSTSLAVKAAEIKTPTEWILVQNEDNCGLNTLYITHDAVKIVNSRLGCHIIAKAPDWKVHCFQPKDKLEWIGRMEDFSGRAMLNFCYLSQTPEVIPMHRLGTATMKGLVCTKYDTGSGFLYVANDISVAPKAAEFLVRLYNAPAVSAIPIYSSTFRKGRTTISKDPLVHTGIADDMRSGVRVNLVTASCKKVPYKASDFESPTHCKRVGSMTSVSFSGDKKSQLNEMLDNVGFMSSTEKNKPKDSSRQFPNP